ncbi:MAG: peptidylprolyl isomerase [Terriglobales bacterium]
MRICSLPATAFALALGLALPSVLGAQAASKPAAPAPDPVVISAGSEHIRASQFQALLDGAPPQNRAAMEANKRQLAQNLGEMMALAGAAHQSGLDQDPQFKVEMLLARDNALAKAMVGKLATDVKPTAAQEQTYYQAHAASYRQTKLKHILISDNQVEGSTSTLTPAQALAKAQKIEAQLKAGADFATLAKADSDDPGSKDKGGELGEISSGQTVPEFESAVAKLPVGQISDPIHTRFGYHIVEVESRSAEPFAQAQPDIEHTLATQAVEKAIDSITTNAHVRISDSYFGPAPKAPAKPGSPH